VVVFLKGSAKKGWAIRAWASPHNHGSGATLCEHYNRGSDSEFVQVIERQLTQPVASTGRRRWYGLVTTRMQRMRRSSSWVTKSL